MDDTFALAVMQNNYGFQPAGVIIIWFLPTTVLLLNFTCIACFIPDTEASSVEAFLQNELIDANPRELLFPSCFYAR